MKIVTLFMIKIKFYRKCCKIVSSLSYTFTWQWKWQFSQFSYYHWGSRVHMKPFHKAKFNIGFYQESSNTYPKIRFKVKFIRGNDVKQNVSSIL